MPPKRGRPASSSDEGGTPCASLGTRDVAAAAMLAEMGAGSAPGRTMEDVLARYTAGRDPLVVRAPGPGAVRVMADGTFAYRPHPFLGALWREMALALRACAPCETHVTGPAGCGKSTVLAALVAMLREMHAAEYAGTRAAHGSDAACHAAVRQVVPAAVYVGDASALRASMSLGVLKRLLADAYAGDAAMCARIQRLGSFCAAASLADAQPPGTLVFVLDGAHAGLFRAPRTIEVRLAARHFAYVAVTARTGAALAAAELPRRLCVPFAPVLHRRVTCEHAGDSDAHNGSASSRHAM